MTASVGAEIERWKDNFGDWYPDPRTDNPSLCGLTAALTRLPLHEYRIAVHEMPMRDMLMWLERKRVQKAFDDARDDPFK